MDQQLLNAIFLGSLYALVAVGYTLVFGVLDILNLAHSAVFMFGAALTYSLVVNHGQPFWIATILAIAACALLGLVIEHVCLRPRRMSRRCSMSRRWPPPSGATGCSMARASCRRVIAALSSACPMAARTPP